MRTVAAIITAYNRADFIGRCVNSLLEAQHDELAVQVYVMDNGSTDGTADAARAAGPVNVLRTEDNRHVISVINRGFAEALKLQPDYLIYMNDDTQFTAGSLEKLIEAADHFPQSMMTPLQLNYRKPEHVDDNAVKHVMQVRELVEDAVLGRPLQEVYDLPTIIGAAMFARREVWEQLGEFDECFWFYGTDDDMCTRARHHGMRVLLVPGSHLFHAHGKLGMEQQSQQQNASALLQKWRKETQCRYLFQLKDPKHGLAWNYLRTAGSALGISFTCARHGWLQGAWHALAIYAHCLFLYRKIDAARQRHFFSSARA